MLTLISREDNDLLAVGFYREKILELEAQHPDWFADRGEAIDYDPPETDPVTSLRQEIRSLIAALNIQHASTLRVVGAAIVGLIIGLIIG